MSRKEKSIVAPKFELKNSNNHITDVIKHGQLTQIYNGPVVNGCYHGLGLIIWIEGNQKQTYEGFIYANRIHGYGRMTYGNRLIFEGLYKDNMRFGPGIMTYSNHQQEVGFWIGTQLVRITLELTTNLVPSYDVPNATTKIKLLQFRDLIDITETPYSIINVRDNNEKYLNNNHSYPFTTHINSLYFDLQTFDPEFISRSMIPRNTNTKVDENWFICGFNLEDLIFKNNLIIPKERFQMDKDYVLNCGIRIGKQFDRLNSDSWTLSQIEQCDTMKSKDFKFFTHENEACEDIFTTFISSKILAYNNNTLDKMILAHAYHQRFGEDTLQYNIGNIWNGKRNMFTSFHGQELAIAEMLSKLDMSPENIYYIVKNYNIDLDVADSRGNTRLMISSANDQHEVIKCVINLGANIECYNDDGFNPLNLNLMRYICILNDIKSWTEYLLPDFNLEFNIKLGNQYIKLNNIQKDNFFQLENLKNMKFTKKYDEIEDSNSTLKNVPSKMKQTKLDSIEDTILLLINMGAKAAACSIPKSTIHLALLCINPTILKAVFKAGGSPLYSLSDKDYKLNLLHMAVMMHINYDVVKCIEVLIMHHVDPNALALSMFSIFQYELPWRNILNEGDFMTPLDILCLKENKYKLNEELSVDEQSESELASILYSVTRKNHTYCGFKPVALAMLTGKLNITKIFLEKNQMIVNKTIPGFGNLLSLLLNPTYNSNLSNKKLNELLDLLLKANLNPLRIVEVSETKFKGNIYEYCFILFESKKLNQDDEQLSNFTKIVKKLKNTGRTILNAIYAKRAKDTIINNNKIHGNTLLTNDKKAMLLWLNSGYNIIMHKIKSRKLLDIQPSILKTEESNKFKVEENLKKNVILLCLQQTIKKKSTHCPINLTQEECQVCYECLKRVFKNSENCSICYFAQLCSANCKIQHENRKCIVQLTQNHEIKTQNKLNENDITTNDTPETSYIIPFAYIISAEKSIENVKNVESTFLSSKSLQYLIPLQSYSTVQSSKLLQSSILLQSSMLSQLSISLQSSIQLQSSIMLSNDITTMKQLSISSKSLVASKSSKTSLELKMLSRSISKKSITLSSDNTRKDNKPQKKIKNIAKKPKKNNNIENGLNLSKKNNSSLRPNTDTNIDSINMISESSISINSTKKYDKVKNKIIKNKSVNEFKNSIAFGTNSQNISEQNNWYSRPKIWKNRGRTFVINDRFNYNRFKSIKYKMIKPAGCMRPIFMFIIRGSNRRKSTVKNLKNTGLSNVMEK